MEGPRAALKRGDRRGDVFRIRPGPQIGLSLPGKGKRPRFESGRGRAVFFGNKGGEIMQKSSRYASVLQTVYSILSDVRKENDKRKRATERKTPGEVLFAAGSPCFEKGGIL